MTVPPAPRRGVLFALIALALGLALVLLATLWSNAQLRNETGRLTAESERLTAETERLSAENAALSDGFGFPGEVFEEDFPFDAEPEPLFNEHRREERIVDGTARYAFGAGAGELLHATVTSEHELGFAVLELSDERGTYFAFAESGGGRFGPSSAGQQDGELELWHRFDTEGTYILTYHSEGRRGDEEITDLLTATLHDGSGAEQVVDVVADYPTDGSMPTYTFDAREGQLAVVTLRSLRPEVFDPLVRVYGPDGELVGMDDDGAGWPDARLTVLLPSDGRYEVEADTFMGEPPRGAREYGYTLTVELLVLP